MGIRFSEMTFYEEILKLIDMHQEGAYWDFKKKWYGKEKDSDQLFDVICMANNLANRDAYIIIGIDEEKDYSVCDVRQDPNRRNTQMLTDFIRSKKFAGDFRPVIKVEPLQMQDGWIDVIVVQNSTNTPFFLKVRYKNVNANNIYVRLQDSNTPCGRSADFHQIEYLWKKRFGMLLTPVEKVKLYLKHPEHWENSPVLEDKKYYKYEPEYTIEHTFEADDRRNGYEYYLFAQTDPRPHWCDIRICYHQTVLADLGGVILGGGRYFTATPYTDGFSLDQYLSWDVSYKYMVKDELNYLVHEFYYEDDGDEARHSHDEYEGCLLIFNSSDEHEAFKAFARVNWEKRERYSENIWIPFIEPIEGYNVEVFKEEYRNVQILRRMLEDFRTQFGYFG